MIYTLLLLLGAFFLWKKKTDGLKQPDLLLAWGVKVIAGVLFLYTYTYYYGGGELTEDSRVFMLEAEQVRNIARESVGDYLRIIFNIDAEGPVRKHLYDSYYWSPSYVSLINDSTNVIRSNSLIYFISGGNAYIHSLFFSFLTLLGLRELYLAFYQRVRFPKRLFGLALLLLPDLLFWTGSILKEPLMILGLCLVFRSVFSSPEQLTTGKRAWRLILGGALMLGFKPYVLICLVPALCVYVAMKVFRKKAVWILPGMAGIGILLFVLFPGKRENLVFQLNRKQFDFVNIGRGGLHAYADTCFFYFRPDQYKYLTLTDADTSVVLNVPIDAKQLALGKPLPSKDVHLVPDGTRWFNYYQQPGCYSYIAVTPINNSFWQLIRNIPEAFVNAAFRPFFGDPGGDLKYLAIIEMLLLFGFFLWQLRNFRRVPGTTQSVVIALLIFAGSLFILIGWITPVLGAIVRYRVPAYMAIFIASLVLYIPRKEKTHE